MDGSIFIAGQRSANEGDPAWRESPCDRRDAAGRAVGMAWSLQRVDDGAIQHTGVGLAQVRAEFRERSAKPPGPKGASADAMRIGCRT